MDAVENHGSAAVACAPVGREALTALLIDDEPHVRAFLRTALRSLGLKQIHEASNGEEGVATYGQVQPSLVLLDINMPVMSGESALRQILGLDPEAVVIMITSESRHETVLHFLNLGAAGYVLKHRPADGVRNALNELLDRFEMVATE